MVFSNTYKDEKELEAIQLIDRAENLADKGKGDDAIKLYEKAADIYIDLGGYIKLDELFIRIVQIISQFKNNIQAIYRLKSIIRKTEELKLYEISAKLLMRLANLSYKMNDWESAGESWEKASEYLIKADPEDFHSPSSLLLLKAGQAYERSRIKKDLGKRLILKAVMKINKFDELYEQEEKRALHLLSGGEQLHHRSLHDPRGQVDNPISRQALAQRASQRHSQLGGRYGIRGGCRDGGTVL